MDPSRVNRILGEWSAVAAEAQRPEAPPRGIVVRTSLPGATLAGAGLVIVGLALVGALLGRPDPSGGGSTPSTPVDPSPVATASTPPPSEPAPSPTTAICDPNTLLARITMWEGAAGHRIAHVEVTNDGSKPCLMEAMARPQLIDGDDGSVLIDGVSPTSTALIPMAPGDIFTTLVQDGNYCGPAPVPPVSVAFLLSDGGWVVASPVSPTDATLPPCLGEGEPATIEMQPWSPS